MTLKKMVPIIITIGISIYLSGYAFFFLFLSEQVSGGLVKLIMGIIGFGSLIMIGALIYTLVIRLKEIDKEDDDDLSKY